MVEKPKAFFENEPDELEIVTGCTKEEILWWVDRFSIGQRLFNQIYDFSTYIPICFAPSYRDHNTLTTYVYDLEQVVVTFSALRNSILSQRQYLTSGCSRRVTTPHLSRLLVCTTPEAMPVITGVEEQAHAYFHLIIEPSLSPSHVKMTKRYDGSDTSEEFAFQSIVQAILRSTDLKIDPLPFNFIHENPQPSAR